MAENVADLTLAHVRKIDPTVAMIWEVLNRHGTRMGRVERDLLELRRDLGDVKRDIGELKSDQILMENRLLNRMDEVMKLQHAS
jgi:hypothetical protein